MVVIGPFVGSFRLKWSDKTRRISLRARSDDDMTEREYRDRLIRRISDKIPNDAVLKSPMAPQGTHHPEMEPTIYYA